MCVLTELIEAVSLNEKVDLVVPRNEQINIRKQLNLHILEFVYGVNCPTEKDILEMQILINQYLRDKGTIRFVDNQQDIVEHYAGYKVLEYA